MKTIIILLLGLFLAVHAFAMGGTQFGTYSPEYLARNANGFPIPPIFRPTNPCVTMEAKPRRGQVMTRDETCPNGWRWK